MATTDIFRSMIAYWKSFDLQKLQEELDRTASVLAVRCEETDLSRQLLLQKSRDFKRNSPEDVQKAIAPLLKSFQSEIDVLLRRSKRAESAFLSIYKKVIRMPDMLPVLMAAEQLQLEVERLSGCPAGYFSEEMKETGESNTNNCTNDQNSLTFESSETYRDIGNCINAIHENSLLTTDSDGPLNNFTADSMDEVSERSNVDEKNVFLQQNSSVHDQSGNVAIGNSDDVVLCDDHFAEVPGDLQGRSASSAVLRLGDDLDPDDGQDLGEPDHTDTRQNEVAADDACVEEVRGESAISGDCRMEMDRRMAADASSQVIHKHQTEPDTDLTSSDCKSSAELHVGLSFHGCCGDEQSARLGTVEQNGECDCRVDRTQGLISNHPWNETGRLKDEEEAQGSWLCKQKFTEQSGDDKDLTSIVISNVESLASEIGQEMVCSYQNSQHSAHNLWLRNVKNGTAEGSALVDIHSTYAAQHSSEFPVTCNDLMPENLKIESADELDTVDISCRIREILSFHNLGQRLFARYVLGLSQGTVSELLSKPKPWDKLTEKGRDSYRKMHQWAGDERNIQILKSLSLPKCNVSSSSSHTDSAAEERIAQILSEAQAAMQCKQEAVDKFQSSMKSTPKVSELQVVEAPNDTEKSSRKPKRKGSGQTSGSRNDTSRHYKAPTDSENLTREIVARIYQEELEKLAQVAEASGNMAELLGYRQELARLNQEWTKRPCKPDAHRSVIEDKENHKEAVGEIAPIIKRHISEGGETTDEPQDLSISGSVEAGHHSHEGVNLSIVRSDDSSTSLPGVLPVSLPSSCSGNGLLSPLQRMQSIANSLTLQSSSSLPAALQPTRVVLPPISQEQFDLHANVNTDDLVKRIKDVLSQYSISQRLFGECVLGLSQGSVSDLLARPKPWHLLTQKGREPFIRMQMFADDPEAVPKLVASQYRVPTEKLLRSNSSSNLDFASHGLVSDSSGEVAEPCSVPLTASPSCKPFRPLSTGHGEAAPSSSIVPPASVFSTISSSQTTSGTLPASFGRSLTNGVGFPSVEVAMVPSVLSLFSATFLPSAQFSPLVNMDVHHIYGSTAGTPSEVGAGTSGPELDTQAITARVKEVLQLNNLGQKLFGEAVLELSQGSVSELLSKPKPWHMLSLKGREPFVKMQIWLQDPLGVQKLHSYQTHMSGRRRKNGCDGSTTDKPGNQKKPRLFFSEEQKESLKAAYLRDPYPNQLAIEQLASELDIGVKTVINWFHNHRMRAKQHLSCNSPTSTTAGSPCSSILARIKSEVPDDLTEQSETRSSVAFPQEDNSASSSSCRSRCDSGPLSGFDARPSKLASSIADPKSVSSFCSSDAFSFSKNSNLEMKRNKLNKRKRARPHRLCSGAADVAEHRVAAEHQAALDVVIDLSVNRSVGDVKNDHLRTDLLSQGQANQDKTFKGQADDSSLLQRSDMADVKTELTDSWSDSRVRNIEKLQQNLLLAPSDDWEF